uniref:Putative ovule protein n=1 Tax=Solanum chacoense TaxID=4108 RepID=A0A0V0GVX0_SOLCH
MLAPIKRNLQLNQTEQLLATQKLGSKNYKDLIKLLKYCPASSIPSSLHNNNNNEHTQCNPTRGFGEVKVYSNLTTTS